MVRRKDSKGKVLHSREYERRNGTYEYRYYDSSGKLRSVYAKSLKELKSKKAVIAKNLSDGIRSDFPKLTVNDLFKRWIDLKRGLKANTLSGYAYLYQRFIESDFGTNKAASLKRSDVKAFYNKIAADKQLSLSTIKNINTVLHQVLELGVEDEYLRYNPSDKALRELSKDPALRPEKKQALSEAEQMVFERYLRRMDKSDRWYPVFTILLWTGMRVGELTGLRERDIDLENNIIHVRHTLVYFDKGDGRFGYALNPPKTKAGRRDIPMLPKIKEAFLLQKKYQEEHGITCQITIDGCSDFIFLNRFGRVWNEVTLNRALKRIIRDCNDQTLSENPDDPILLPHFTNHTLRHSIAARMVEADFKLKAMQTILGHADAETTIDVYAEASDDLKRKEFEAFEAYFNSQMAKHMILSDFDK